MSEIFRSLGQEDAQAVRERQSLGDSLRDSVASWTVIGNILGAKMHVRWVSDTKAEADHSLRLQCERTKKHGNIYCEHARLPHVGAVAEGICKGVKMAVVRPADNEAECIKALVFSADD